MGRSNSSPGSSPWIRSHHSSFSPTRPRISLSLSLSLIFFLIFRLCFWTYLLWLIVVSDLSSSVRIPTIVGLALKALLQQCTSSWCRHYLVWVQRVALEMVRFLSAILTSNSLYHQDCSHHYEIDFIHGLFFGGCLSSYPWFLVAAL